MKYFQKILISNRGEIARRIIRACKSLDIKTVAIYSDSDIKAPFVEEADEAYNVGPAIAQKSYLNIERIIEIAKKAKVDAIHPGYGFLSENPHFARRCEEEGIKYIGPKSSVIELMGSKVAARKLMKDANVPVVPGWDGQLNSLEDAIEIANEIGYPIMLKASAGGGGMGIHLLKDVEDLKKVFPSAKKRASAAFGDDTIFLEKYIQNGRHIEVQILGDNFGRMIHLFDRECSIQRRNQKVLEESPSPALLADTRAYILESALNGCRKIGYTNAGTMEFIYDIDTENFYFLEMNTRLQVEHPITEEITGLDLVALQIKVAANQHLDLLQQNIKINGHAIEVRVYAEDPVTYIPSSGVIEKLSIPSDNIRLDFGVEEGLEVSPYYDPMIGKIIVHAENRERAITKLNKVLMQSEIEGIKTNLALLIDITNDKNFKKGMYSTKFLETQLERGMVLK